jgi:hypothetical protein
MQHRVEGRHRAGFAQPRVGHLPELARRQAELAAERSDVVKFGFTVDP